MSEKSILFDLDGTLTDSGPGIINCAIHALAHFGIEAPDREAMRVFVGPPLHDSFVRFGVPADQTDEAIRVYRARYVPVGMYENEVYPGIEWLLKELLSQGHKLYVATSKPEWMAKKILEEFGLDQYFTLICGATTDKERNTKEAVIAYLLELCGRQGEMIMVGDTIYDIRGANYHNIPAIGVDWGYGESKDMIAEGAIAIAYTMEELLALISA